MTDTTVEQDDQRPLTRRDLVEGRIERAVNDKTSSVAVKGAMGSIALDDMVKVIEAAKLMSAAGPMLPPWLQGNVGGCWAIIIRAMELGFCSPLTLANWTYVADNRGVQTLGYESQFYHAIVEAKAPIKDRLVARYEGSGDETVCIVSATFRGETVPREWPPKEVRSQFTLGKLRPPKNEYGKIKGSPLWERKAPLQLFYDMSRDWARVYCPDILGGVYAADEVAEIEPRASTVRDVSPKLTERLRGLDGEGFAGERSIKEIDDALNAARSQPDAKQKEHAPKVIEEAHDPPAP